MNPPLQNDSPGSLDWGQISELLTKSNLIKTGLLLLVVITLRHLIFRVISQKHHLGTGKRRSLRVTLRNSMLMIFVVGTLLIWARELQPFALTLLAFSVAISIAAKELIQCVAGSLLRTSGNVCGIGDRIEFQGLRGDVIDQNVLCTTILEIGPGNSSHQYTGRTIVLPNNLLTDAPIISENYTGRYIVQILNIPLNTGDDWQHAESILLEVANEECSSYVDDARRHMDALETRQWIEAPSVTPRVTVKIIEAGKITLMLRIPAPARRQRAVEQRILRRFLKQFYSPAADGAIPTAHPKNITSSPPTGKTG